MPRVEARNRGEELWRRRISLVCLIHYSGKNAVFLPPELVFPLVTNCLADHRHYMSTAVGWVLREMGHAYPGNVTDYLEANAGSMSATAFSRAIERRPPEERTRLRTLRTAKLVPHGAISPS